MGRTKKLSEETVKDTRKGARIVFCSLQMRLAEARVTYWSSMISSGAYKTLVKTQKSVNGEWVDLTDEEKLVHALGTLHQHIRWMEEIVEAYERDLL